VNPTIEVIYNARLELAKQENIKSDDIFVRMHPDLKRTLIREKDDLGYPFVYFVVPDQWSVVGLPLVEDRSVKGFSIVVKVDWQIYQRQTISGTQMFIAHGRFGEEEFTGYGDSKAKAIAALSDSMRRAERGVLQFAPRQS